MWFLAFRQLFSKKKQTSLIFLGISFGTMIYVVISGVQYGSRDYLSEQLLNNTAHVVIKGNERLIEEREMHERFFGESSLVNWIVKPAGKREASRLENPQGWFSRLDADPGVLAYSPRLTINAILSRAQLRANVALTGIVPERHVQVTSVADYVVEGSLADLRAGTNSIVVGRGIVTSTGVQLGQTVLLSTGVSDARPFKIVGVIELGNQQIDETIALTHLNDVQMLNRSPGRVSEISVALVDIAQSESQAAQWTSLSNDKVQGWEEANAVFMQVIKIQDVVRYVITGAILLVSAFGIYNVLSIMISQKQKEIAILRSIGYGPDRILSLILIQGLALGICGGVFGLMLGHLINLYVDTIDLGFKIGKGTTLIVSYKPSIYLTALVAALVSSLIASLLPARAAARMTPLDIIRANL